MEIFLAGGAVRDLLLGRPIADRDYLVTGTTREAFQKKFPTAQEVGHAFPVFLLKGREFSFPRRETLTEELRSRDLTVNALLLDSNGDLICHPQGLDDLHSRIFRPASRQSFLEDSLRIFRAARFRAALPDFTPHEELIDAMRTTARRGLLDDISADRIGMETRKALASEAPGNFLRLLAEADCLNPWFREFKDALSIPAGPLPYHDTNVLEHTCRVMDSLRGDPLAVWGALCHDIGKTLTPPEALPSHHGHDQAGTPLAEAIAKRLRLPNTHVTAGVNATRWHMVAAQYESLRPGTKVDLLMHLHTSQTLDIVFALVEADQDKDFSHQARADLRTILKVRLPREDRNLDAESGKRLRILRAQALA